MFPASAAAIMFADVSGSSRLFKQAGDTKARSIISKIINMMVVTTINHGGRVIKTIGDECMSAFPSAEAALHASAEMHGDVEKHHDVAALTIRIGFHYGDVIVENGDIFGEAVNDAADLVKIAKGGQTITCQRTITLLPEELQQQFSQFDEIIIKGGTARELIYLHNRFQEDALSDSTVFRPTTDLTALVSDMQKEQITLSYQGQVIVVKKSAMPFTIGRSSLTDLNITFALASREHCILDYRHGKFVLIDKSTNGTYVAPTEHSVIYLRREETPLRKNGKISFAPDFNVDGPHILYYQCE